DLFPRAGPLLHSLSGRPVAGGAPPGEALGDFRIEREIGRGGMGIVYEAVQISLGRRVALKVLPLAAALDAKQLWRFLNEAQAAEALEHAHQLGVIHRDVKPGNLLVDARGDLWLTDFGLAQGRAGGGVTCTGDLMGTLRYMSPEQAGGQRVPLDPRTDVYSLG